MNAILGPQGNNCELFASNLHLIFNRSVCSNGKFLAFAYHSLTIGDSGSLTLEDLHLFEKHAHFNRERIPERVVHAKGGGGHGYFEVTQ